MVHTGCNIGANQARCVCDGSGEQQNGGAGSHSVAPAGTGSQWPCRYLLLHHGRLQLRQRRGGNGTQWSASSRKSLIPADRGDCYTRSDGRAFLHRGTGRNPQAALCRETLLCGWTTSKPRKSSWMSRICWFTCSWTTEIEAIAPYA